jgi:hypothetical protein
VEKEILNRRNVNIKSSLIIELIINIIIAIIAYFKANPAKTVLPGHDASTCASGNQIEKGKQGIFTNNINIIIVFNTHNELLVSLE